MLCQSKRSEESRAGAGNYTAKDFASFFANTQNDIMVQTICDP